MTAPLQPWTLEIPFTQQIALLTCLRGYDASFNSKDISKQIIKHLRRAVIIDSKRVTNWNRPNIEFDQACEFFIISINAYSIHFVTHLLEASKILAIHYPDSIIREYWQSFADAIADELNMIPEPKTSINKRLK